MYRTITFVFDSGLDQEIVHVSVISSYPGVKPIQCQNRSNSAGHRGHRDYEWFPSKLSKLTTMVLWGFVDVSQQNV
jgi:hypothetical protein